MDTVVLGYFLLLFHCPSVNVYTGYGRGKKNKVQEWQTEWWERDREIGEVGAVARVQQRAFLIRDCDLISHGDLASYSTIFRRIFSLRPFHLHTPLLLFPLSTLKAPLVRSSYTHICIQFCIVYRFFAFLCVRVCVNVSVSASLCPSLCTSKFNW